MEHRHVLVTGVVTAIVGFASSAVVVLAGLSAVGATDAQAASGLLSLCVAQGIGTIWLSRRRRLPVVLAWSTPGAALLASTGAVDGGWPAAVGAFLVTGVLVLLTALLPWLGTLIARIPAPVATAMLAGVLLDLCLAPVRGLAEHPVLVAPAVLTWLVLLRWFPRWAVPGAFVVALVTLAAAVADDGGAGISLLPHLEATVPSLTVAAVLSLALPLYVVTMTSQNVPGAAVLTSYGYPVPWREAMAVTGLGTLAGAPTGGHAVNLAAITAALVASPDAHPDPRERWRAADTAGWSYLVLGLLATALAGIVASGPIEVVTAVAGLALLGTLAGSLSTALTGPETRVPAVVTFVVAASGVTFFGIGAAFWSLAAGLVVLGATTRAGTSGNATTRAETARVETEVDAEVESS
jgi:benzoate membrane transport protein